MAKVILSLLILGVFTTAQTAIAANYYVRAGAVGANNGNNWADAYDALPSDLVRGATYYVADGNYSGYTFDDEASGTALITIKKCTANDHGTENGYSADYCDGQAGLGSLQFTRPYYVVDGAARNENDWTDYSAYGFQTSGVRASRLDGGHIGGDCSADNLTFKYMHVGATTTAYSSRMDGEGFYVCGFGSGSVACENWTIHRSLLQNLVVGIQCAGCRGLTVEYSHFNVGWGKEAIRGQVYAADMIVRNSIFKDSCQRDIEDPTSGCTAEIALWDGSNFDNNEVYGNVFYKTTTEINTGGVVVIGGDGTGFVGPSTSNSKIYNNTLAGYRDGQARLIINGGSGNSCQNNIWYDIANGVGTGCTANSSSNNEVLSDAPFVSYEVGDFHLVAATSPGTILGSPYNVDLSGVLRGADDNWDLGAYEYTAGGSTKLMSPTNLRVVK